MASLRGIEILLAPVLFCKRAVVYFTRVYSILPDCRVKWDSEPGETGCKFRHIATYTTISNSIDQGVNIEQRIKVYIKAYN